VGTAGEEATSPTAAQPHPDAHKYSCVGFARICGLIKVQFAAPSKMATPALFATPLEKLSGAGALWVG
jgi:hypothetical protein